MHVPSSSSLVTALALMLFSLLLVGYCFCAVLGRCDKIRVVIEFEFVLSAVFVYCFRFVNRLLFDCLPPLFVFRRE